MYVESGCERAWQYGLSYLPLNLQARIKKIMQKDEEVGKVAQATPVVICASFPYQWSYVDDVCLHRIAKALELFLGMIVAEASKVTIDRNAKRVEAYHLCAFLPPLLPCSLKLTDVGPRYVYRKHAVEQTEMLDFLREIVQSVPDPSAGGTIDLDGDDGDGRRRRGPARKRKRKGVDNDMDEDGEGAEEDRTFVSMNKRAEASVGRAEGGSHKGRWRVKQSVPHDDEDEE